jgi:hypothetical protein
MHRRQPPHSFAVSIAILLSVCLGCAGAPSGIPAIVESTADRYLSAWQENDWVEVYTMEGRTPDQPSALHNALTDSLAFFTINEIRYSESAAACAVTLHWQINGRLRAEAGELYLSRVGPDWRITSFRGF